MVSVGLTERESAFPGGEPIAQFDSPDTAHHAVAHTFPLCEPWVHHRAWAYGRRIAWLPFLVPDGVQIGDSWHRFMAHEAGEVLRATWAIVVAYNGEQAFDLGHGRQQ